MTPLAERNAKIVRWATENPCSTMEEIGRYYGITRERVRQIIAKAGAHKQHSGTASSKRCGQCHARLWSGNKSGFCSSCRGWGLRVTVVCDGCGEPFERRAKALTERVNDPRYKGRYFCSGPCAHQFQGKEMAEIGRRNFLAHNAIQRARTHCKNGHEYAVVGFYLYGPTRKARHCKACAAARGKAWRTLAGAPA